MRDRLGRVIYVGKAIDLKKRVSSYFRPAQMEKLKETQPKIGILVSMAYDVEFITVKSEAEALILEGRLIKQFKPKYNTIAKDDKRYLFVRVDLSNPFPQFRLVRNCIDSKSRYFGPFTSSVLLKKTLHQLRSKYGILLGDTMPKEIEDGLYRLYDDMRGEIYNCPNETTREDYLIRIQKACAFLEGKSREWMAEIEEHMVQASQDRNYEKAAEYRDLLEAMRETLKKQRNFTHFKQKFLSPEHPMQSLQQELNLESLPENIECFDISHISGTFVVASMVHFTNAEPDKALYRRFKIKTFEGNDDYQAMREVVGRHYKRLYEEGKTMPNLIVIDGGQGQVNAALRAFVDIQVPPPMLIGLAKKEEMIIFPDHRYPKVLPRTSAALKLLQRIRDEAHRFANAFNAELRSKKLKESILEDFTGIGPVRKEALLEHFGSIQKLKRASVEELEEVRGIGPETAKQLHAFLRNY